MMALPAALRQDLIWIDREGVAHELTFMDPDHRSNLIPFLRGNCRTLYWLDHGKPACDDCGGLGHLDLDAECETCEGRGFVLPDAATSEDWLEDTPLMRRLTLLEARRPFDQRKATYERNVAHERETGYRKVRLG